MVIRGNMENTIQTDTINVVTVTKNIAIRATLQSPVNTPFDYDVSIDDAGQIVLTPNSLDTVFINATIEENTDETEEDATKPKYSRGLTNTINKEFTINITASMLCDENSEGLYTVNTDAIGQCVVTPTNEFDTFVTASVEGDLNLITEEYDVQEYLGYKLYNMGDGWDVVTPEGQRVEEGVATLTEAKIFICREELHNLKKLQRKEEQSLVESAQKQLEDDLTSLTNNYQDQSGIVLCDNALDQELCVKILSRDYTVTPMEHDGKLVVKYTKEPLVEELEDDTFKQDIINKFLMGELPLFSYDGEPEDTFLYLPELDAKGYRYYFDPESGSIISFQVE